MRAYLRTFGCRANQYDTEAVRTLILASGGEIADRPDEADVVVMNSCAVTAEAEADLRQAVRRVASDAEREGRTLPTTLIIGCAAARDDGRLAALPGVARVIAGADLGAVAATLQLAPPPAVRTRTQRGTRALLRIQDGCDEHCTFCATTLARGRSRSRAVATLVEETLALADDHPEIVLTGVHIGSYGADIGASLGALVERLVLEVPRVRFRLTSIEATEVDDRLRDLFRDGGLRVAPHLHAPLQSGSDAVLRRMGRHWYDAEGYATAVRRVVEGRPTFALSGDVMTGFPGERDEDHRATVRLVDALPFTDLHVFPYSERPGTAAARLGAAVPAKVARERAAELRSLAKAKAAAYQAARAGGRADVIVLGGGPSRRGLTEDYLTVLTPEPAPARGSRYAARLEPVPPEHPDAAPGALLARPH